jgi:hypothetical protein
MMQRRSSSVHETSAAHHHGMHERDGRHDETPAAPHAREAAVLVAGSAALCVSCGSAVKRKRQKKFKFVLNDGWFLCFRGNAVS